MKNGESSKINFFMDEYDVNATENECKYIKIM